MRLLAFEVLSLVVLWSVMTAGLGGGGEGDDGRWEYLGEFGCYLPVPVRGRDYFMAGWRIE